MTPLTLPERLPSCRESAALRQLTNMLCPVDVTRTKGLRTPSLDPHRDTPSKAPRLRQARLTSRPREVRVRARPRDTSGRLLQPAFQRVAPGLRLDSRAGNLLGERRDPRHSARFARSSSDPGRQLAVPGLDEHRNSDTRVASQRLGRNDLAELPDQSRFQHPSVKSGAIRGSACLPPASSLADFCNQCGARAHQVSDRTSSETRFRAPRCLWQRELHQAP